MASASGRKKKTKIDEEKTMPFVREQASRLRLSMPARPRAALLHREHHVGAADVAGGVADLQHQHVGTRPQRLALELEFRRLRAEYAVGRKDAGPFAAIDRVGRRRNAHKVGGRGRLE